MEDIVQKIGDIEELGKITIIDNSIINNNNKISNTVGNLSIISNDTNRIIGWAMMKVRRNILKKIEKNNNMIDKQKEIIMSKMVTKSSNIFNDEKYLAKYYSISKFIRNRGGLSLVDPVCVEYWAMILKEIVFHLNFSTSILEQKFDSKQNHLKENIIENKIMECIKEHVNIIIKVVAYQVKDKNIKVPIYKQTIMAIIKKVINCRLGQIVKHNRNDNFNKNCQVDFRPVLAVVAKIKQGKNGEQINK